jgi:hypothetical protein
MGEAELREVRGTRIAMIFQEPITALDPVFTIGEQIACVYIPASAMRCFGAKDLWRRKRARPLRVPANWRAWRKTPRIGSPPITVFGRGTTPVANPHLCAKWRRTGTAVAVGDPLVAQEGRIVRLP